MTRSGESPPTDETMYLQMAEGITKRIKLYFILILNSQI